MCGGDGVRHLGPADLHDGTVVRVERAGSVVRVELRGATGRRYAVTFRGVSEVHAHRAEGMMVYALSELPANGSVRRFAFTNWDEEDDAALEVMGEDVQVEPLSPDS